VIRDSWFVIGDSWLVIGDWWLSAAADAAWRRSWFKENRGWIGLIC
jgi:hypothetical protein